MKRRELKDLGADSLYQLLKKANDLHIGKDQIVQILKLGDKDYHMIYVEY